MLGKVIVHGPDREAARRALVAALDDTGDPRPDHQRRLPARAGRERRVPRRDDRHRLARPPRRCRRPTATCRGCSRPGSRRCWRRSSRPHPFQGDGFRLGGPPAPTLVELDRDRASSTGVGRHRRRHPGPRSCPPRTTSSVLSVDGRREPRGRQRAAARRRGRLPRPAVRLRPGPTASPTPVAGRRRRRSPRRCPAPCSPSASRRRRRGRGRRARRARGDEDGARPQGAVRRHRRRGRRGGRRPGRAGRPAVRVDGIDKEEATDGPTDRRTAGPALPERVTIYEVGPRDGLQNESALVPTEVKAELIRRLVAAGLPVVEATSFVHPKWVPQLADAAELLTLLGRRRAATCPVLVPNERGLDRALELGCRHVAIFGSATETFAQQEPQPQPRRAVRDVRADRTTRARRRARRPGLRLDVLRRPVGGRRTRSSRSSASASGSSTSAPASSASATPSASAPPAT